MTARPELDFAEIKRTVSILQLLRTTGWEKNRLWAYGGCGKCPFHESSARKHTSFKFTFDEWFCHKCRIGGDVINLWQRMTGKSTFDAAYDLCRQVGMTPPIKRQEATAPHPRSSRA